jgi:cytochrome c peroxidase
MSARVKRWSVVATIATLVLLLLLVGQSLANDGPTPIEQLGEHLYFDQNLSTPKGQACADCHLPSAGFDDPDSDLPVSAGVLPHRFGDRNSPASAYAMYAPFYHEEEEDGDILFVGGQFWDGRATGFELGDPLADQALGPFLNPVEMANPLRRTVINSVKQSDYADLFEQVWGEGILKDTDAAYQAIALSIAAFERTETFAAFNSPYDQYLQACLGAGYDKDACATGQAGGYAAWMAYFSESAWNGFQLFMDDEDGGAKCVLCHVADWTDPPASPEGYADLPVVVPDWSPDGTIPPLFTDFTYDNLGVPKNWDNPFLYMPPNLNPAGADYVDVGLGKRIPDTDGMFKVMTLRNIGLTAPYAHNGFFQTLGGITHFYNTRDALDACEDVPDPDPGVNCWPAPEVPDNVNIDELGDLGLSAEEEADLVAFMLMLSDQPTP